MSASPYYPPSPEIIPDNLTAATASYKRHAIFAMFSLLLFIFFYIALMLCFAGITYYGVMDIANGKDNFVVILITLSSLLLSFFMLKSLFTVRRTEDPKGIEVTQQDEPALFEFLYELADEIGAPRPHRVFITAEVNAAVFYDLSLLNLLFPSKKNLIIGLALVNVLSLGELKAVLAHEFGHFAQNSMLVGRWVYIAQQIISHMVSTRDWLDNLVRMLSRIDIRIAWIGWILTLIIWSIRSLMDTLFKLVVMAERALSREMEFNADLVSVSVCGSDALIHALYKLQSADQAWRTALDIANTEAGRGNLLTDLFQAQKASITEMKRVLNDKSYGSIPEQSNDTDADSFRLFTEEWLNLLKCGQHIRKTATEKRMQKNSM